MKKYFTISELCHSNTANKKGIDNSPSNEVKEHLEQLIEFLNPLREAWGSAITISSGYRCEELNKAVGGANTSAHLTGWAVDMIPSNHMIDDFSDFVKEYLKDKEFDECLIEKSTYSQWVHFALFSSSGLQRKKMFELWV